MFGFEYLSVLNYDGCILMKTSFQHLSMYVLKVHAIYYCVLFSGYDRKLPGFPRYTVLGSDASGEYSLKVTNATLEDDAVYECQVGPAPNNKPIRASARLNVMRK